MKRSQGKGDYGIVADHRRHEGAGKTAVLGEASDILAMRQIVHAAMDPVRSALLIFRPPPAAMV
jgi:hypothetical protein